MQCLQYVFLFSTLSTKAKGMCEEASKQSSDLKNYTAPVPRPRVFKFLDPPLSPVLKSRDGGPVPHPNFFLRPEKYSSTATEQPSTLE